MRLLKLPTREPGRILIGLSLVSALFTAAEAPAGVSSQREIDTESGEVVHNPLLTQAGLEERRGEEVIEEVDPTGEEPEEEEGMQPFLEPGLVFEGDVEVVINKLKNTTLGQEPDDNLRESEQEVNLGLSYAPHERFFAFGEIKFVADQEVFDDGTPRFAEEVVERGETWLFFKQIYDSRFSLQLGRQSFFEPRLWWWDADLDALRVYYDRGPWSLYMGLAEEIAPVSTQFGLIDPENDNANRVLGHGRWQGSERLNIDAFLLHQRDHSSRPPAGSAIKTELEDESDADLTWAGLRASGDTGMSSWGALRYRLDGAFVTGNETLFEFEEEGPDFSIVESQEEKRVRGWALDLGFNWAVPLPRSPSLTFIYAHGSGDKNHADDTERAFHQTGLQDKDEEFRDYGQLLRPELSNLRIATIGAGFSVHRNARLWLGYHRFRQIYAAPFVRDASLDIEPTGKSRDIGQEISLVYETWPRENLRFQLIAASFEAGDAYGISAGERASRLYFKVNFGF
ncbi:MAG: alginate export family protein [Pseudomonadota bacterium]|nr:alginate export family protein [Pseudomonadota bacterium]